MPAGFGHKAVLFLLSVAIAVLSSCGNRGREAGLLPISRKAIGDSSSIYYGNFQEYPELPSLPLGVFDCCPDGFSIESANYMLKGVCKDCAAHGHHAGDK